MTEVDSTNFEKLVLDKEKDVLLFQYSPACGHSKMLVPTWKQLGRKYEKNSGVLVTQMDVSAHTHASLKNKGFPKIAFFGKGAKKGSPSYFQGKHDLPTLVEFFEKMRVSHSPPGPPTPTSNPALDEL